MIKLNEMTDAHVVALSLENSDNFEQLVTRYEKKLFRYIKRLSGLETESVEDVLQETFIKIYRNLNDYDDSLSFSSWAYRITHNETVSYLRKNKKVKLLPLESDKETGNLIEILKSEIDVAADISKKDAIERIRKAINMLPEKYRDVLILRYIEDLNYTEISDVLKIPMGSVATLVSRAKSKFKDIASKLHLNSLVD